MRHNRIAINSDMVDRFLQVHREMWEAAKTMSRIERHQAVDDIYAEAGLHRTEDLEAGSAYVIDDDGVAHIPVVGVLTPKVNPCAAMFGDEETEYGFIRGAVAQAESDPGVLSIALEVDSPGGYVDGVDEAAMAIASAEKPTVANVHNMAASAAYWLASQADRIVAASPADVVGSIGVAVDAIDFSGYDAQHGIKRMTFTSTDAPDKRLDLATDEGAAKLIAELDDLHAVFARRVAYGRKVGREVVNADFGRGGVVIAEKALAVGMIDEVRGISLARDSSVVDAEQPAAKAEQSKEGVMDIQTLKTEHSEVFAAAVKIGVNQERARVNTLRGYIEADPDNERVAAVVNEAITDGKSAADAQAKLHVAIRDGGKLDGENPPEIQTEPAGADEEQQLKDLLAEVKGGRE